MLPQRPHCEEQSCCSGPRFTRWGLGFRIQNSARQFVILIAAAGNLRSLLLAPLRGWVCICTAVRETCTTTWPLLRLAALQHSCNDEFVANDVVSGSVLPSSAGRWSSQSCRESQTSSWQVQAGIFRCIQQCYSCCTESRVCGGLPQGSACKQQEEPLPVRAR